eukprot:CAMPEP_0113944818 /NCGR_PEP_ID=MMETSP1339-20121228/37067_1 /TAXON_ID=94617 /ORGANISM="Fibrocapsa japonica" /LENGTH=238 /DNA_ID=CAMNT_0000950147 /DNA_START=36 /DNA_END=752 /DNA_ORIENTATION=+ /assembly_acc=CAM_ASM_000762
MSTAHKPTYHSAKGTSSGSYGNWSSGGQVSRQFSAKDLPGHTKLKYRQTGQNSAAELSRVDREELQERADEKEKKLLDQKHTEEQRQAGTSVLPETSRGAAKLLLQDESHLEVVKKYDDKDIDANNPVDSDLDDSDSDDEEEELQRELEKIRKEREEARVKKEREEAAEQAKLDEMAALSANPLVGQGASKSAQVKRRWNDDVVFKNQARTEPAKKKQFVNDTIRNDFHRRFLAKYIM